MNGSFEKGYEFGLGIEVARIDSEIAQRLVDYGSAPKPYRDAGVSRLRERHKALLALRPTDAAAA